MATQTNSCADCGSALVNGLCPRCLLAGVAIATEPTVSRLQTVSLVQVAAAFPGLEVVEMIGQGGMGSVFKVRQPKLDRFAALKLLPQSLAGDAGFAGRFEREARLLARLSHPNIVSVYDYGLAGNFYYLLMEFVDGVNLRQAMRASRFEPRQALGIVPKICEALQYAHDEGVLHRDIKPENILLDTRGRVKLVDFGIAKLTADVDPVGGAVAAIDPAFTQAGAALGTPSYMAPEQREHPSAVDHRADIYSLGVVFYELLTGELPGGGLARPSEKSGADPRVDAIVQQALEKERDRRQASAGEVRTQVETLGQTPVVVATENRPRAGFDSPGDKDGPRHRFPPEGGKRRFSLLALLGAGWAAAFFLALPLFFVHQVQQGPQVGPTLAQRVLQLTLLPLALTAPFGATILGWIAVWKIRRSMGRMYGLGLAVFDGLVFPLLVVDGAIAWAWWLGFQAAFPEFFNGGSVVDRSNGHQVSLQSMAILAGLLTSLIVDGLISWKVWRVFRCAIFRHAIDCIRC